MLFKGPYNKLLINQNQNSVIIPKEINEETTADTTTYIRLDTAVIPI